MAQKIEKNYKVNITGVVNIDADEHITICVEKTISILINIVNKIISINFRTIYIYSRRY